jgi:hypothetical protein
MQKAGETVGGGLDKEGPVGRQFTDKGAVGGTINSAVGEEKK